ncbi:MAG: hypothetical protein ACQETD_10450, partial [Pseudomonadota bacterium]
EPKPAPVKVHHKTPVWESIFYATEVIRNSWALGAIDKRYHFTPARQRDYNERGYRLEYRRQALSALDVGELIGLRQGAGERLELCTVRWLREEPEYLVAGLLRLAEEIEPVLVLMEQGEESTPLGCLLGIGEDGHPQLYLPHLPTLQPSSLQLVIDHRKIPIALRERVTMTPLFEAYHFTTTEQRILDTLEQEMDLTRTNSLLHAIARSDEMPPLRKHREDFSDLWESL